VLRQKKNILASPIWWDNFWIVLFKNCALWCTLYFWATTGSPNVAGPGVTYPSTPVSRRACGWQTF